jgi:hypothetical protein
MMKKTRIPMKIWILIEMILKDLDERERAVRIVSTFPWFEGRSWWLVPSSPGGKRMRPSTFPFPSSQDDVPIDIGPEGLFGDIFPDPDFPSSSPIGHLASDFPGPDVDMP